MFLNDYLKFIYLFYYQFVFQNYERCPEICKKFSKKTMYLLMYKHGMSCANVYRKQSSCQTQIGRGFTWEQDPYLSLSTHGASFLYRFLDFEFIVVTRGRMSSFNKGLTGSWRCIVNVDFISIRLDSMKFISSVQSTVLDDLFGSQRVALNCKKCTQKQINVNKLQ